MDSATKLFKSLKESQIHKIKSEFDNFKKSSSEATEELNALSEEIEKLKENNSVEFSNIISGISQKIDETITIILKEDLIRT